MRKALSLMLVVTMLLGNLVIPQPAWSQEASDPPATREEAALAASESREPSEGVQGEASPPATASDAATGQAETAPVAETTPAAPAESTPAAETTPAAPAESTPAAETTPAADPASREPSATTSPYLFAGTLESYEEGRLRVRGQGPDGEDLTLEFATDEHSQVVDGLKATDRVSVLYEVVEGGYVVVSARFAEGELPANRFPAQGGAPATATAPATSAPAPAAPAEEQLPRVVSIEIEGNQKVPAEEVLQVVSTRIGDPLLEPRIRRDMQAIFDIGYFTDVRLDTRYRPGWRAPGLPCAGESRGLQPGDHRQPGRSDREDRRVDGHRGRTDPQHPGSACGFAEHQQVL